MESRLGICRARLYTVHRMSLMAFIVVGNIRAGEESVRGRGSL